MAPEVIKENAPYTVKADIWSLGITAIEMAEVVPPLSNIHPMRALFMINRNNPPKLANKQQWSLPFHEFIAKLLTKDPRRRCTAQEASQDRFVSCVRTSQAAVEEVVAAVQACEEVMEQRGYGLASDSDTEEPPSEESTSSEAASTIEEEREEKRNQMVEDKVDDIEDDMAALLSGAYNTIQGGRKKTPLPSAPYDTGTFVDSESGGGNYDTGTFVDSESSRTSNFRNSDGFDSGTFVSLPGEVQSSEESSRVSEVQRHRGLF